LFIACLAEDEKKTGQAFEELLEVDSQLACRLDANNALECFRLFLSLLRMFAHYSFFSFSSDLLLRLMRYTFALSCTLD
jgi:hypothetical protein